MINFSSVFFKQALSHLPPMGKHPWHIYTHIKSCHLLQLLPLMLKSSYRKYPISPWVNLKMLSYLKGVCEGIHSACQSVRVFVWLADHRQIHDTHPDASSENSSRQLLTLDTSTSTPTYIRGIWYHRTHANLINRDPFPPQLWPPVN